MSNERIGTYTYSINRMARTWCIPTAMTETPQSVLGARSWQSIRNEAAQRHVAVAGAAYEMLIAACRKLCSRVIREVAANVTSTGP